MNIINRLTLRHLLENKRRTLVTIIGTIISVAMIMAVATLAVSFMDMMKRHTIAIDGEWHVQFMQVNEDQVETVMKDENTESVILSRERGYALLENSQNVRKPYLHIREYSPEVFEYFSLELVEGRLPEAENEIVLSTEIAEGGKIEYQLGEVLTLDVGQRMIEREEEGMIQLRQFDSLHISDGVVVEELHDTTMESYKVVGFIEPPTWDPSWAPGFSSIVYLDKTKISSENRVNVSVVLKKVDRSIYVNVANLTDKLQLENPDEGVRFHSELLRYYGFTNNDRLANTLYSLSAIIMSVIMVGSVALIYNSFAISVSERSRHLGMLSSVGATKKQKRNSVFFEGAVIGAISIPLGIVAGVLGIGVTFVFLNSLITMEDVLGMQEELKLVVTPVSILVAFIVSIVTIFISTYMPARKASKVTAIDAIRQTTDIKLTRKGVKTSPIIRKLFGMEAELGLKNLKRNKRKYQITVFSLVVSIVLFLVVSFFTASLEKSVQLSQDGYDYDLQVYLWEEDQEIMDTVYGTMLDLANVTRVNKVTEAQLTSWVKEDALADPLKKMIKNNPDLLVEGKYDSSINFVSLPKENMKMFAEENGVDLKLLTSEEGIQAILVNTLRYQDYDTGVYIETKSVHTEVGEKLGLYFPDWEQDKRVYLEDVTIAAITENAPMGVHMGNLGIITLVVTDDVLHMLLEKEERINWNTYYYLNSNDPNKTHEEIQDLTNNMSVYNVFQARQRDQQMILFLSVFVYGFITLITIISIANIFNTISTSIALRKREFAMLQSVGMTPKSFKKMINFESLFYGIKSLLYGIPISIGVMYAIWRSMRYMFDYGFELPWVDLVIVVVAVFLIVGSSMLYSTSKVRKENIIETLKQENI